MKCGGIGKNYLHIYSINYRITELLNSLGLWPLMHLLHQPQTIKMGRWWKSNWQGRTKVFGETLVSLSLRPPQIPHGMFSVCRSVSAGPARYQFFDYPPEKMTRITVRRKRARQDFPRFLQENYSYYAKTAFCHVIVNYSVLLWRLKYILWYQ